MTSRERGLLVGERMSAQKMHREITLAAKPIPILDFEGDLMEQF